MGEGDIVRHRGAGEASCTNRLVPYKNAHIVDNLIISNYVGVIKNKMK